MYSVDFPQCAVSVLAQALVWGVQEPELAVLAMPIVGRAHAAPLNTLELQWTRPREGKHEGEPRASLTVVHLF